MKSFKFYLLILLLMFPFIVKAEAFEYQIVVDVQVEDKEIEKDEFAFNLIDAEGNVVQTKKNSADGKVYFDPISFEATDATTSGGDIEYGYSKENDYGYRFYIVQQVIENENDYVYDKEEAYIGVYCFEDGTSEINYLKDIDTAISEWTYKANRDESKIFHATEDDLQGQAYAVYDYDTEVLTFFRDEPGKYVDNVRVGSKRYFTGFEDGTTNEKWHYIYDNYRISENVKKIVFEDAIRPTNNARVTFGAGNGWFNNMYSLEEVENFNLFDTSLLTEFDYMFYKDKKLKKLDLSAWDTSNVTDMSNMFTECYELKELNIDNFDTKNATTVNGMFSYSGVETIDPSIFDFSKIRNVESLFDHAEGIMGLDFSSWNLTRYIQNGSLIHLSSSIRFVDVSQFETIGSEAIGENGRLSIVRLGGKNNWIYSNIGPYDSYWYDTQSKTLYNFTSLTDYISTLDDSETLTLVRPDGNTVPSLFTNKFIKPKEETSDFVNPETGDKLMIIFVVMVMSIVILNCIRYSKTIAKG